MLDELILNIATLDLFTAKADMDVQSLMKNMYLHQFRRIPIVDNHQKLLGIVTLNDLFVAIHLSGDTSFLKKSVDEIKNPMVLSIPPHYTIREALQFMLKNEVTGIPICENNHLKGIVTARDILFQDQLWMNIQNQVIPPHIIKQIKPEHIITINYSSWQAIDRMIRINLNHIFVKNDETECLEYVIKNSDLMKSALLTQERMLDPNYLQTQTIDRFIMKPIRKITTYDQIKNVRKIMITRNSGVVGVVDNNVIIGFIDELSLVQFILDAES